MKLFKTYYQRLLSSIHLKARKKQLKIAIETARDNYELAGRKSLILEFNGEIRAVYKSDFKRMWHSSPQLKTYSIEKWEQISDGWFKCYQDLKHKFINSN